MIRIIVRSHAGMLVVRAAGYGKMVPGTISAPARNVPGTIPVQALVEFVVDQHDALRREQHRRPERDLPGAEAFEGMEGLLRHRHVVGQEEAGIAAECLFADRGAFPVQHVQCVVGGEFLHQSLEARGAYRDAGFDGTDLVLAHAGRRVQRVRDLRHQGALVEAADGVHVVCDEADRSRKVGRAFQHQVDGHVGAMRLRHENRIHQGMGEDFGMRLLADGRQQLAAFGRCGACSQYEGSHACPWGREQGTGTGNPCGGRFATHAAGCYNRSSGGAGGGAGGGLRRSIHQRSRSRDRRTFSWLTSTSGRDVIQELLVAAICCSG
jgi:hypothetical protein